MGQHAMDNQELLTLIAKVRRDLPRVQPVLDLCRELEARLFYRKAVRLTRAEIQRNYRLRKKTKETV